ncbi:MAG: hypothetical protein H7067_13935 [Burkholderiales bacterium]|nr:hypothetical protein [Opitutaceae bacterium]
MVPKLHLAGRIRLAAFSVALILAVWIVGFQAGCGTVQAVADAPGKTVQAISQTGRSPGQPVVDPVEVQQNLLRFADEFSVSMTIGVDTFRHGASPFPVTESLKWKIAINTQICAIASGTNAVANLLDMTIFVTALRMSLEEHSRSGPLGESVRPMLASAQNAEAEIWKSTGAALSPEQVGELRQALEIWRGKNPLPENVFAVRALGVSAELERSSPVRNDRPGSVFGLLKLDPLAGMDPAVREIARTRLLAERGLFLTQKMPQLLRWQLELLNANALASPTVQQLVTNTTTLTASVDRVSRVAEELPAQVDMQREKIMEALDAQAKQLTPLVAEVRQTLGTGRDMSNSLNTTLVTLDALMKRFGVGEPEAAAPPGPPAPPSEPFRIQDYTVMAAQLEKTSRQLTELLAAVNQTVGPDNLARLSEQVAPAVKTAQAGGKDVVDYAFWKAVQLVGVILLAVLLYRFLSAKFTGVIPPK